MLSWWGGSIRKVHSLADETQNFGRSNSFCCLFWYSDRRNAALAGTSFSVDILGKSKLNCFFLGRLKTIFYELIFLWNVKWLHLPTTLSDSVTNQLVILHDDHSTLKYFAGEHSSRKCIIFHVHGAFLRCTN